MNVPEFYAGQQVFITGGSGFVGKVLIEKLLRSCPDIGTLYIAIRPKKGVTMEQRWEELSNVALFDQLKKEQPDALKKVKLVYGDLKEPNLGLSEDDVKLLTENVTMVYHAAAAVQFNNNVVDTLVQNTKSTYQLLELCKSVKKLMVFVYVSTTYTNFYRPKSQWGETLYPPEHDWRVVMKLIEHQPEQLASFQEKLLGKHPNPYTFSKSLSEYIVSDYHKYFPTVIVRPSIVMPIAEEPLKGWVDSLNGMGALWLGNALGVVRVAMHGKDSYQDYVSVDYVAMFLIISAMKAVISKDGKEVPLVYNCTFGKQITLKSSEVSIITANDSFIDEFPSKKIVWVRNLTLTDNLVIYNLYFFLFQLIPACVLDISLKVTGNKPLFLNLAKKLSFANRKLFKDFNFAQVHFPNDKYVEVLHEFKKQENQIVGCDLIDNVESISFRELLRDSYIGVLKYCFKEDMSEEAINRNRKRLERIRMLDKTLKIFLYGCMTYISYYTFQTMEGGKFIWDLFDSINVSVT